MGPFSMVVVIDVQHEERAISRQYDAIPTGMIMASIS